MDKLLFVALFSLSFCAVYAQTTPKSQALITSLPGLETMPTDFQMYSGYIELVNSTKNIFYWFVTASSASVKNPANAPVVLWLQGGPGCSGLGDGLLWEHGPYYTYIKNATTKEMGLRPNFYSWNKLANMIYIESPCGVGFSYGLDPGDYVNNDNQTAIDNFKFLEGFYQVYSEYQNNPLWISSESYGGVYNPTLSYLILTSNQSTFIASNLKKGGMTLGNPVTGCGLPGRKVDPDIQVHLFYWHGMASARNYNNWINNGCSSKTPPSQAKCDEIFSQIYSGVGVIDQPLALQNEKQALHNSNAQQPSTAINPDCLYYDYCTGNATLQFVDQEVQDCLNIPARSQDYLNEPSVQKAIHAKPTNWEECGGVIYSRTVDNLLPYIVDISQLAPGLPILYYSGDIDIDTVPFAQTQQCLEQLNRPIKQNWRPYSVNKEVAGYVEVFDIYTYATIKGAGHEAPGFQPKIAFTLYSNFINGTLPN